MLLTLTLLATQAVQQPTQAPLVRYQALPKCLAGATTTGTFYGVHTLCVASTGRIEKYFIDGPPLPLSGPTPLIVLFHSYGADHNEFANPTWGNYDFLQEAKNAGYLVMMHDGGWDNVPAPNEGHRTYGSPSFHKHTEAAIKDVMTHFNVDRDRVYGYGFSMGGGNVLNYAARNLNPTSDKGMFAAVVNHTGAVSVPIEYFTTPGMQWFYDGQYGDTYFNDPFKHRRATVLDIPCDVPDPGACFFPAICSGSEALMQGQSLARNLRHLPTQTYYNACDSNHKLVAMNNELDTYMNTISHPNYTTTQTVGGPPWHVWYRVPSLAVLGFFGQHDLVSTTHSITGSAVMFVKNNARTLHFKAKRTATGDFGRLTWNSDFAQNQINYFTVANQNLDELTLVLDAYNPITDQMDIKIGNNFGPDIPLKVSGLSQAPLDVLEGASSADPADWSWDGAGTVTIHDLVSNVANWTLDMP